MKLLAYTQNNFASKIVTIYDALNLRITDPEKAENSEYYDIIGLRPMIPVDRGRSSSSFSFLNGEGQGHGKGSKGIAHELVQESICKLNTWQVKFYGKSYCLKIASADDEWLVRSSQEERRYYVDCLLNLAPDSDLFVETGGRIGIEVTATHAVGPSKKKELGLSGEVILELKMIDGWHVPNERKLSGQGLRHLRSRINGCLNKVTYLNCLSKPQGFIF